MTLEKSESRVEEELHDALNRYIEELGIEKLRSFLDDYFSDNEDEDVALEDDDIEKLFDSDSEDEDIDTINLDTSVSFDDIDYDDDDEDYDYDDIDRDDEFIETDEDLDNDDEFGEPDNFDEDLDEPSDIDNQIVLENNNIDDDFDNWD